MEWIKSSWSESGSGQCVEVAAIGCDDNEA